MSVQRIMMVAGLMLAPVAAGAQTYPRTIVIAQGDTVVVYKRTMFERGPAARHPGRRLDYLYATRISASDSASRHVQADRAAQIFGGEATTLGVRQLSIGLCDTPACAEGRAPPALWFLYELGSDGWRRVLPR